MFFRFMSLLIAGTLLFAGSAWAELKIGYIDSEIIFSKYKGTKDAQKKFDKEAAAIQQKATDMEKEIQEMQQKLEKQSLLLSETRKKELEEKMKKKYMEYQQYVAENYGRDGKLIAKNAQMTQPIIEEINRIIEKLATEENYDFILDAKMGGLVYADKKYDLTKRVLDILNKER